MPHAASEAMCGSASKTRDRWLPKMQLHALSATPSASPQTALTSELPQDLVRRHAASSRMQGQESIARFRTNITRALCF